MSEKTVKKKETKKEVAKKEVKGLDTTKLVKKVKNIDKELLIFRCTKKSKVLKTECGNLHFRHAGYMEVLIPYVKTTKEGKIQTESLQVKVCTKCKSCYVYIGDHYYDVTKDINLEAWEETEKTMQKATGPGGDC